MSALRNTSLAAALVLGLGLAAGTAQAGIATPATATAAPSVATTENVRWVCGLFHCWWRPNAPAFWGTPGYAAGWGPPPGPRCFWRRGWGGWNRVCP